MQRYKRNRSIAPALQLTSLFAFGIVACRNADVNEPNRPDYTLGNQESSVPKRSDTIPNSYIVIFSGGAATTPQARQALATALTKRHGGTLTQMYEYLGGFAVDNLPGPAAAALAKEAGVAYVEPNMVVYPASLQQQNPGIGLDRLDQINLPLDQSFNYAYDGTGVHVYILDSGIDTTGGEFAGRVGQGKTCYIWALPYQTSDAEDHGTGVASVAAGTQFGVAKKAIVHSVRISWSADGSASNANVECGINWILGNAVRPAVANWSYGSYPDAFSTRDAINTLTSNNISFVKAAGNEQRDAYEDRANRATNEWVVAALDPTNDQFAGFSDWGENTTPTVNMIAPGVNIRVADKRYPGTGKVATGTSIAAPFLTGVIAQYLQVSPNATTQVAMDGINNYMTTYGIVSGFGGPTVQTPNKALHSVLWCVPTC